ncbi:MAG: LiaI-LiaF-like domain-containing protein, partial [Anaerolineae bacterium]
MNERRPKRIDILGPVLLIAIGIILLLNTMGILEWSVWWRLIRLWPVLLIAAGLELLLGRRSVWG